ncbi:c-type cytochrome biogenesis protein CcmI [Pseudomonas sp. HK3]|jgi:cytochrome c-type biogenesis protein CcmH
MFSLWLGVAVLLVLAVLMMCLPLFVTLRGSELKRQQSNVDIYKSQLADLESDLSNERIDQAEYEGLSQEIKSNLLIDTQDQQAVPLSNKGKWVFAPAIIIIFVFSIGLYMKLGSENELVITQLLQKSGQTNFTEENAHELIERLNVQTTKTPEDTEMWYLLGRLNFDMGQFDQAVLGFTQALQLLPIDSKQDQAVAMAQLAQAQFFANDRTLNAATQSLLKDVLAINPNDETSLGLLGVSAYDNKRYVEAVGYWQRLISMMPVNNPNVAAIEGGINKALERMTDEERAAIKKQQVAVQPAVIQVTVNIAQNIISRLPKNADLFVLAKAENGPPMPLAVQRIDVNEWPVTVTLDDSMAMMPSLRLSQFKNVVITARISKSGVGNAKPGDLQGVSAVIGSDTKRVSLQINEVVK